MRKKRKKTNGVILKGTEAFQKKWFICGNGNPTPPPGPEEFGLCEGKINKNQDSLGRAVEKKVLEGQPI